MPDVFDYVKSCANCDRCNIQSVCMLDEEPVNYYSSCKHWKGINHFAEDDCDCGCCGESVEHHRKEGCDNADHRKQRGRTAPSSVFQDEYKFAASSWFPADMMLPGNDSLVLVVCEDEDGEMFVELASYFEGAWFFPSMFDGTSFEDPAVLCWAFINRPWNSVDGE